MERSAAQSGTVICSAVSQRVGTRDGTEGGGGLTNAPMRFATFLTGLVTFAATLLSLIHLSAQTPSKISTSSSRLPTPLRSPHSASSSSSSSESPSPAELPPFTLVRADGMGVDRKSVV